MLPLADPRALKPAKPLWRVGLAAFLLAPQVAGAETAASSRALTDPGSASPAVSASAPWRLEPASGFGLFAKVRDRRIDAAAPSQWVAARSDSLFDDAAGLEWRQSAVSAMVGYMRISSARPLYEDDSPACRRPRGRFGIALSLHY